MSKAYVGTPGVKRHLMGSADDPAISSAIIHEETAHDEIIGNPSFHIYQRVCRGLLEARQEPTVGQHIHDHLWACWMADMGYTEAVEGVPDPPVEILEGC